MDSTTTTIGCFLLHVSVSKAEKCFFVCVFFFWAIKLNLFAGDIKLSWTVGCLVFAVCPPTISDGSTTLWESSKLSRYCVFLTSWINTLKLLQTDKNNTIKNWWATTHMNVEDNGTEDLSGVLMQNPCPGLDANLPNKKSSQSICSLWNWKLKQK